MLFTTAGFAGMLPLSWNFNHDGGFGFYQPEGWTSTRDGRSSRLFGPKKDFAQSQFFVASDWVGSVKTLEDLHSYVELESGGIPETREMSGLPGFAVSDELSGQIWVLRAPTNLILIHYDLRGSPEQIAEGREVLSSIEIRTSGIEYP